MAVSHRGCGGAADVRQYVRSEHASAVADLIGFNSRSGVWNRIWSGHKEVAAFSLASILEKDSIKHMPHAAFNQTSNGSGQIY
jgi:arginine/lysine/ornithine decarboxylase